MLESTQIRHHGSWGYPAEKIKLAALVEEGRWPREGPEIQTEEADALHLF